MASNQPAHAQDQDRASQEVYTQRANTPETLAWYQDLALGMYLYWTVDAVFGMVNAHSVVGASQAYLDRYFRQLPLWFNPQRFDAGWYARLAATCGFDYVTVTAKNHNGFCMWDTATTDFKVTNTAYGRDILHQYTQALRARDIPVGFYFSPDDAWFQWRRGREVTRSRDYCNPEFNPELLAYDQRQLEELITVYDPDILCVDGYQAATASLVEFAWDLKPELMVTRGGITTPEQEARQDVQGPFESHYTIGRQWQYRAGNDRNKTGRELIELLVDCRSRGGTLLLAIGGPDADGVLPRDKDDRVRELGLWMFVNGEAMQATRPWLHSRQGDLAFTQSRDGTAAAVGHLAHGRCRRIAPAGRRPRGRAGCLGPDPRIPARLRSAATLVCHIHGGGRDLLPHPAPVQRLALAQPGHSQVRRRGRRLTLPRPIRFSSSNSPSRDKSP